MSNMDSYWRRLVSTGLRYLQDQGKADSVAAIRNSTLEVAFNNHDNWDGGIDYWDLIFHLKYKDYTAIEDKKDVIEGEIRDALDRFHTDVQDRLAYVLIQPVVELYIDWNAITPITKDELICMIQDEQAMLTEVATGKLSFKTDGIEDKYQERHRRILTIADRAGFEYPVTSNTLVEWWGEVKAMPHYSERREYISKLFSPLLNMLRASEESESSDIINEIITTQVQVQSLSQQAYERFESAKRQFENVSADERARKDAVRSCVDAMEALIKELGSNDEIGEATRNLKDDRDDKGTALWGPPELVKDGNNLFKLLHRLYPDVRHGTQDLITAGMTMEEAEYFVGRVTTFMKYIAARAKKLGRM